MKINNKHVCKQQKIASGMATTNNRQPQAVFFKITSSLLKLANYCAHGDETLCACVFHCFHDNRQQKIPSGTFPYNYFFTSQIKLANHAMHGAETCYACVFKRFHDNHEQKMASGTFFPQLLLHFSILETMQIHGSETWYVYVIQCFHDNHQQNMASGTFFHDYFFTSKTCKPCNVWK